MQSNTAIVLRSARQHDQALEKLNHVLEMRSDYAAVWDIQAHVYDAKGMHEPMVEAAEKAVQFSGGNPGYLATLGRAYALAGRRQKAQEILEQLNQRAKGEYVRATRMAQLHLALGDRQQTLAWLKKGYEERDIGMVEIKVNHEFDPLRQDPEFRELLRKMGFPEN